MDKNRIIYLFELDRDKKTTPSELEEFRRLLLEPDAIALLKKHFDLEWDTFTGNEPDHINSNKILNEILFVPQKHKKGIKKWNLAVAVAVMVIVSTIGFFFINNTSYINSSIVSAKKDIPPGKTGATLTLANGKKILLSNAANGMLTKEAGVKITKSADGQLIYEVSNSPASKSGTGKLNYNTLTTARGEQYQVRLPDSSIVWLNAASALKYPTSFTSLKDRSVELSGEAYFQIAKDKQHPFLVYSQGQIVKVLGTHFNINSYTDETAIKTTLLEGSVKVTKSSTQESEIIKPGQQTQMTSKGITILNNVDLDDIVAWKDGYFIFNENLKSIMNKVGRWYDVDVIYEVEPDPNHNFQGKIARNRNISEVLKIIEYQGIVHFKIERRRIIVTK